MAGYSDRRLRLTCQKQSLLLNFHCLIDVPCHHPAHARSDRIKRCLVEGNRIDHPGLLASTHSPTCQKPLLLESSRSGHMSQNRRSSKQICDKGLLSPALLERQDDGLDVHVNLLSEFKVISMKQVLNSVSTCKPVRRVVPHMRKYIQ